MAFVNWLVTLVINWLWSKISAAFLLFVKIKKEQGEEHDKNKKVKEKLEKAETPEEIDDALNDALDRWRN